MTVPDGLVRCLVCGMYRGTVSPSADPNLLNKIGQFRSCKCLCDGVLCKRCGVNKLLRPGSNVFYEETGRFEHVPILPGMSPCKECRLIEETELKRARRSKTVRAPKR